MAHHKLKSRSLSEVVSHLDYVRRGTGFVPMCTKATRKLLSPAFETDAAYIAIRHIHEPRHYSEEYRELVDRGISAEIVTSVEELDSIADHGLDGDVRSRIREYVSRSSDHVAPAMLSRIEGTSDREFIGYHGLRHGAYSYWDDHMAGPLPDCCVFGEEFYVTPKWRGNRVHYVSGPLMFDYCLEQGRTKIFGFIKCDNTPSIQAHKRTFIDSSGTFNGIVRRTKVLGSLFEQVTPNEQIFAAAQLSAEDAASHGLKPQNAPGVFSRERHQN